MKILFCTNAFETVSNGPAKFAHLLLEINTLYPEHEIRILTEDSTAPVQENVYRQKLRIPRLLRPAGMFLRMFQYHAEAMRIRKEEFTFDRLVYNNAIVAVWSGLRFKNTIGFINDDNNVSVSWRNAFLQFRWSRKHLFFLVERLASRTCRFIVVNSDYLRNTLMHRYHIQPEKIKRLYKAVDGPMQDVPRNNIIPVILFVKNDYVRGGLFTLIDALHSLGRAMHLVIIGTPATAEENIRAYCSGGKFTYSIMGIQPQKKVFEMMEQADIFCVPSFREALGVANMEAMSKGCAVISTRVGGIPEVMHNGACGWLVEPGRPDQLCEAIAECLDNAPLRAQKKSAAFTFMETFKKERMLREFINYLQ